MSTHLAYTVNCYGQSMDKLQFIPLTSDWYQLVDSGGMENLVGLDKTEPRTSIRGARENRHLLRTRSPHFKIRLKQNGFKNGLISSKSTQLGPSVYWEEGSAWTVVLLFYFICGQWNEEIDNKVCQCGQDIVMRNLPFTSFRSGTQQRSCDGGGVSLCASTTQHVCVSKRWT